MNGIPFNPEASPEARIHSYKNVDIGPLYALASNNKIKYWRANVINQGTQSTITYTFGYENGVHQHQEKIISIGKNIGKANETTHFQQACKDAESKANKKMDEGYCLTKTELTTPILPMLAHSYTKRSHNIKWPCYVQPKIDGCFVGNTLIDTDRGLKRIDDIVNNKLKVSVKSYNQQTEKFEYKPVINWFYNGKSSYNNWCEIIPEKGKRKQCTLNHKFLTKQGWFEAQDLEEHHKIFDNNYHTRLNSLLAGTLLGDSSMVIEKRGSGTSYRLNFSHVDKEYFDFKKDLLGLDGNVVEYTTGYGSQAYRFVSKALTQSEFPIDLFYFTGHNKNIGKRKLLLEKTLSKYLTKESLSLWIADDGSLSLNNKNKFTPVLNISTHNHSNKQLNEFIKYFQKQWQCTPTLILDKRVNTETGISGKSLKFNTKDTLYILNQLKTVACRSYEYKYYFTESLEFIKPLKDEFKFVSFKRKKARNSDLIHKYDIEVEDNHNYVANGTVVHNCRCTLTIKDGVVKMFTRKGKEFTPMPSLVESVLEWQEHSRGLPNFSDDVYLDGELYSDTLTFQELAGTLRRHKNTEETLNQIYFVVFDAFQLDWDTPYIARKAILEEQFEHFNDSFLKLIETDEVTDEVAMKEKHQEYIQQGYEGTILRNKDAFYKLKHRSADLQKYKDFIENEYEIIGAKEDDDGGITWKCKTKNNKSFWARSRGSLKVRKAYLNNINKYIGQSLTVVYQELTDDGIPRFPSAKLIRTDKMYL